MSIPRLYAAASLKLVIKNKRGVRVARIPRLYAAASLKQSCVCHSHVKKPVSYSAALCRGLIEASQRPLNRPVEPLRIPRLYAAASLKRRPGSVSLLQPVHVFRGFMPRPH